MTIEFFSLPKQILIKFLQRVNPRPLCRLRQTCSSVDQFVEKYRFSINCQFRPHSLWIRLMPRDAQDEGAPLKFSIYVMKHPVKWRYTRDVYEAAIHPSPFPRADIHVDLYSQLSALSFPAVVVDTDYRKRRGLNEFERNSITSLLEKLRLKCDWLSLYDMSTDDIPWLLPLIRFSKINFTFCKIRVPDLEQWPIQHCKQLSVHRVSRLPSSIESITKREFLFLDFSYFNEADFVFTEFLKAISLNESAKGNLKYLRLKVKMDIGFYEECRFKEIFSTAECVCYFEARSFKSPQEVLTYSVHKIPLQEEVGYVFRGRFSLELHFMKENSRDDLFSAVTALVFQQTTPLESHLSYKDDFIKAENDARAILRYTQELFALMRQNHE